MRVAFFSALQPTPKRRSTTTAEKEFYTAVARERSQCNATRPYPRKKRH